MAVVSVMWAGQKCAPSEEANSRLKSALASVDNPAAMSCCEFVGFREVSDLQTELEEVSYCVLVVFTHIGEE